MENTHRNLVLEKDRLLVKIIANIMYLQGDVHFNNITFNCDNSQRNWVILFPFYKKGSEDMQGVNNLYKVS